MTDTSSAEFRSPGKAGKRSTPNISGGWLVMILSFLVAMVVYFYVTQQSNQLQSIAVASSDISAGQKVTTSSFRSVSVNVPREQLNKLLAFDELSTVEGSVASTALTAGDPILKAQLRPASAQGGLRAMSVPNDPDRSAGGAVVVGDRVDVIDASQGGSDLKFIAENLEVLAVANNSGGGLTGGSNNFSITVAVTPQQASALSAAINAGKFDIVRSTGANPIPDETSSQTTSTTAAR